MPRTLTALGLQAIRMTSMHAVHLIELNHSGGNIRLTDHNTNLDVDVGSGAVTWTGAGSILGIGASVEAPDRSSQGIRLEFSGITKSSVLNPIMNNDFRGRNVQIWRVWLTDEGNLIDESENILAATWTVRGTASVVKATGEVSPGGYNVWNFTGINTLGVDDVFNTVSALGEQDRPISPRFYIRRVSTTGVIVVANPFGGTKGDWDIDLSLLGGDWELIEEGHPALTEQTAWALGGGTSVAGLNFGAQSGGPLSFDVAEPAQVYGDHIQPGHYVPTDSASVFAGTEYAQILLFKGRQLAPYQIKVDRPEGGKSPATVTISTRVTSTLANPQGITAVLTNPTSHNLMLDRGGISLTFPPGDTFFQNVIRFTTVPGRDQVDRVPDDDFHDRDDR